VLISTRNAGWMYRAGHRLARFCFGNFGRLEVIGRESVPPYGPLIVVANHLSNNDPPMLVASLPRPLNFIAKQELFRNAMGGYFLKQYNVFPFNRSGHGVDAMRLMLRLLAEDRAVVIFPEGHRSPDHAMKEAMLGVAYLAHKSQAPILPVGVTGTQNFPVWRLPFPLTRMRANIGQPFTLPMIEGNPSRQVLGSLRDMIMGRIAAVLPEEYRGVYAITAQAPRTKV
jgi:1-acyl-sn-glycerol-3-phosphate acyltransferase